VAGRWPDRQTDQPEAAAALQYVTDMVQQDLASKDVIDEGQYKVTNTF
jgi:hypothetical protein